MEGKTIVELREIAKSLGIVPSNMKKQELFEKIVAFAMGASASEEGSAPAEPQREAELQEAPRRGRRPRMASVKISETASQQDNEEVVIAPEPEPKQEVGEEQAPAPAKRRGRKPKAAVVVEESAEVTPEESIEPQVIEPATEIAEEHIEESEDDDEGEYFEEEFFATKKLVYLPL